MTRSLAKWGLTAVLAGGALAASAAPAQAQFMPGFRPGWMWSNPYNGMQFSYNSWQQSQWGMNWVNPYNGMRMSFGFQSSWAGFPPYAYPGYAYPAYTPG